MLPAVEDGAIVRIDDVFQQVFQRAGIVIVGQVEELELDAVLLFPVQYVFTACIKIVVSIQESNVHAAIVGGASHTP